MRAVRKELLLRQDLRDIIDGCSERPPQLGILFDEERISQYGEDVFAFKSDVEAAFKHMLKMRIRVKDVAIIKEHFTILLEDAFDDIFPKSVPLVEAEIEDESKLNKKRSRQSELDVTEDSTTKKTSRSLKKEGEEETTAAVPSLRMTYNQKTALKSILNSLMKNEMAEVFLYPVDSSMFPEYYEIIKNPRDLSTIKEQLNKYETVEECLADLRLIWANCRLFNSEGSDIADTADALGAELEEMVEAKLGVEYVKKKRAKSKKTAASISESGAVVPSSAPPASVALTSASAETKKRSSLSNTASSSNANSLEADTVAKPSKVKAEKAIDISSKLVKPEEKPKGERGGGGGGVSSGPSASSSSSPALTLTLTPLHSSLSKKAMKKIITDVKATELAQPFLYPVSLSEAPSYTDYITQPMDLSTVEKSLKAGKYDGEEGGKLFSSDLELIWSNCVAYNDPLSEIAKWAMNLGQIVQTMISTAKKEEEKAAVRLVPPPVIPIAPSSSTDDKDKKASDAKDERPVKRKKYEKSSSGLVLSLSLSPSDDKDKDKDKASMGASASAAHVLKAPKRQDLGPIGKRCWRICKQMSGDPRTYPFLHPIDLSKAPGYLEVIKRPIDMSVIKNQLETYENCPRTFHDDMVLMFDNCLAYNTEGSEMWRQAEERKSTFEKLYVENIGSDAQAHMLNKLCPAPEEIGSPGYRKVGRPLGSTVAKKTEGDMMGMGGGMGAAEKMALSALSGAGSAPHMSSMSVKGAPSKGGASASSSSAAPPLSLSVSVVPLKAGRRMRSIEEVDKLLKLLDCPEGMTHPEVREKAAKKTRSLLPPCPAPYTSAWGNYEILDFGEIVPSPSFCCERFIFPKGFVSKRTLKMCIVSDASLPLEGDLSSGRKDVSYFNSSSSSSALPFASVVFTNAIQSNDAGQPVFTIAIEGDVAVSESDKSPRDAWLDAMSKGDRILSALGSKLRRCRAVFNRLCTSPFIVDFLEPYPLHITGAADYYRVIKAPMWLRLVHSRLVEGTYDNEFDFAWDVRLVFANCCEYNAPQSELYIAAQQLTAEFEILLCDWVHNIRDVSVDDLAVGPWDDWAYLKYFDAADFKENFCRLTGTRTIESELNDCTMCEDQYLRSLSHGLYKAASKDGVPDEASWICARCVTASQTPIMTGLSGLPKTVLKQCYGKDSVDGHMYFPAPEFGPGWCQAKRRNRLALKNIYLSPLGYELFSKEEALAHQEFEKNVHDNLLISRETEYRETRESEVGEKKPRVKQGKGQGHGRGARHKRAVLTPDKKSPGRHHSSTALSSSSSSPPLSPMSVKPIPVPAPVPASSTAVDEEGLLSVGKLCDFKVPTGCHLIWYTDLSQGEKEKEKEKSTIPLGTEDSPISKQCSSQLSALGIKPITSATLPQGGFFGLDEYDVRSEIEALAGSEECVTYHFWAAKEIRDSLIAECKADSYRMVEKKSIDQRLVALILEEKNHWVRAKTEHYASFRVPFQGVRTSPPAPLSVTVSVPDASPSLLLPTTTSTSETTVDMQTQPNSSEVKSESGSESVAAVSSAMVVAPDVKTLPALLDKPDFQPLFPANYTSQMGELALCLWDFLDASSGLTGELSFSLMEIIKCIPKPETIVPTLGQMVFDEICTLLSGVLLSELQRECINTVRDFTLQEILLAKPLNIITWPFIARSLLIVLRQSFKPVEAMHVFNAPATEREAMLQDDILCLVFSHPCLKRFLFEPRTKSTGMQDVLRAAPSPGGRTIFTVRYRCLCEIIASGGTEGIYETLGDFADDLVGVFLDTFTAASSSIAAQEKDIRSTVSDDSSSSSVEEQRSDAWMLRHDSRELATWLSGLLDRWSISHNKAAVDAALGSYGRDVPGLGAVHLATASTATDALEVDINELMLDPFSFSYRFTAPPEPSPSSTPASASPPPTPFSRVEICQYMRDMRALSGLERTLHLLRTSDPESWSTEDRMAVLSSLMDKVGDSHTLKVQRLASHYARIARIAVSRIDDIPDEPTVPLSLEAVKVSSRSSVRCHLSGAEAKYVDASAKWVAVPEMLLSPPTLKSYEPPAPVPVPDAETEAVGDNDGLKSIAKEEIDACDDVHIDSKEKEKEGDKRTRVRQPSQIQKERIIATATRPADQLVALESAVLKVAAAREVGCQQMDKQMERLKMLCMQLPSLAYYRVPVESELELNRLAPVDISRGNPLGRDRHGNEYWLLFAQRRMPIFSQGTALALLRNSFTAPTFNPQVLMRTPSGTWGVHSGFNMEVLISSFSTAIPCEHFLRESLLESVHFAKKSLLSKYLVFRPMQMEWVDRHARAENHLKEIQELPAGLDIPTTVKRLETLWAKYTEVRCMVHNGCTFRNEMDVALKHPMANERVEKDALQRRLKKMKDYYQDEVVEHHPVKGWFRFDAMGHLRELWCATSADRMHADPMVCQQMILTAKKSKFLSTLIPYTPPVITAPAAAAIVAGAGAGGGVVANSGVSLPTLTIAVGTVGNVVSVGVNPTAAAVPVAINANTPVSGAPSVAATSSQGQGQTQGQDAFQVPSNASATVPPSNSSTISDDAITLPTSNYIPSVPSKITEEEDEGDMIPAENCAIVEEGMQVVSHSSNDSSGAGNKSEQLVEEGGAVEEVEQEEEKDVEGRGGVEVLATVTSAGMESEVAKDPQSLSTMAVTDNSSTPHSPSHSPSHPQSCLSTSVAAVEVEEEVEVDRSVVGVGAGTDSDTAASASNVLLTMQDNGRGSAEEDLIDGQIDAHIISEEQESKMEIDDLSLGNIDGDGDGGGRVEGTGDEGGDVDVDAEIDEDTIGEMDVDIDLDVENNSDAEIEIDGDGDGDEEGHMEEGEGEEEGENDGADDIDGVKDSTAGSLVGTGSEMDVESEGGSSSAPPTQSSGVKREWVPQARLGVAHDPSSEHLAYMNSNMARVKVIEQLHILTNEVLRVYPSGSIAAAFLNVSQSGISLCCSGTKPDAYGFKWRFYEGPPIDWNHIANKQMSIDQLQTMQVIRGKRTTLGPEDAGTHTGLFHAAPGRPRKADKASYDATLEEYNALNPMSSVIAPKYPLLPPLDSGAISLPLSHRGADFSNTHNLNLVSRPVEGTANNSNNNSNINGNGNGSNGSAASNSSRRATLSTVPPPATSSSSSSASSSSSSSSTTDLAAITKTVSTPSLSKINGTPQLVASTVLVSARMAKLKAELVNIFYSLPEKPMRWIDKDDLPVLPPVSLSVPASVPVTVPSSTVASSSSSSSSSVAPSSSSFSSTSADSTTSTSAPASAPASLVVAAEVVSVGSDDVTAEPPLLLPPTLSAPLSSSSTSACSEAAVLVTEREKGPGSGGVEGRVTESVEVTVTIPIDLTVAATVSPTQTQTSTTVGDSVVRTVPAVIPDVVEGLKETKVERKLKRRLKRRQNNERVMSLIQTSSTPQELMSVLMEIEEAIPKNYKYNLSDEALPSTADTCAALAVRIYVLDRRIRYDEIKDIEKQGMDRQYKPRYHFAPRCLMSSTCTKFLNHHGKCSNDSPLLAAAGSRIPDINDSLSNYANINAAYLQQRAQMAVAQSRPVVAPPVRVFNPPAKPNGTSNWALWRAKQQEVEEMDTPEKRRRLAEKRREAADIDIDFIQPFVPVSGMESIMIEWV